MSAMQRNEPKIGLAGTNQQRCTVKIFKWIWGGKKSSFVVVLTKNEQESRNVRLQCWNLTSNEHIVHVYFECRSALRSYIQPKCSIFFFFSLTTKLFIVVRSYYFWPLTSHTACFFSCSPSFVLLVVLILFFFCRNKNRRTSRHWLIERFGVFFFICSPLDIRSIVLTHAHFPWPGFCLCPLRFFFSLKTLPCRYTKQNDKLYVVSKAHIRMHVCIRFDVCLCTPRHSPSS